jgi:predicted GNAT superfamily acetyltransferase
MSSAAITVRTLSSHNDYRQAEQAQRIGWELRDDTQVIPLHVLLTAQKNGGLAAGAFDETGQMVGFLFGFLGLHPDGHLKHCSHLMCIDPQVRSAGIGAALKRFQADYVRAQGIDLITWTYDPLEGANATLNIARLRAITHTFYGNLYGDFDDALNAGLPTDRLEVEWWINTPRVTNPTTRRISRLALLESGAQLLNPTEICGTFRCPPELSITGTLTDKSTLPAVLLLEVPAAYQALKRESMAAAKAWRQHSGQWLPALFEAGYTITDFITERGETTTDARNFYVLETL